MSAAGSSGSRTSCACWSALRDAIRRREIWIDGAAPLARPRGDLPERLRGNRDVHYAALRQPLDPTAFIADLQSAT